MNESDRFRFQGLHALSILKVLSRHLRLGYTLLSVERGGNGYRYDLLFANPSGKTRLVEVKSSKKIREMHMIQAALYSTSTIDEIVVSNRQEDQSITAEFIEGVHQRAERAIQLFTQDPTRAATTYTPNMDTCYTCANNACPYLPSKATTEAASKT
jgi:hypothetical protein